MYIEGAIELRRGYLIIILCGVFVSNWAKTKDADYTVPLSSDRRDTTVYIADSIMRQVIQNAETYSKQISNYEADLYIKGHTQIKRQNFLILFAHHIIPVDRKSKESFFEVVSQCTYNAPNSYKHHFCAVNGTQLPDKDKQKEALSFLNINAYTATAYKTDLLMPVAPTAFKHYNFELARTEIVQGHKIYIIHFYPKQLSRNLVSGTLSIVDKLWTIDHFTLRGVTTYAAFDLEINFGRQADLLLLPEKAQMKLRYCVLGNEVETTYQSFYKYKRIERITAEESLKKEKPQSLDLSKYYQLSTDTVPVIKDTAFWEKVRTIPLSPQEKALYETADKMNREKKMKEQALSNPSEIQYLKLTENITTPLRFDKNTMRLKYSGILNPFQLGYSAFNGLSYQQKLRVQKEFKDGTILRFNPEIGYVFKRKAIFYKLTGEWEYWPEKLGTLSFTNGNGNQAYSSEIIDDINELLKDSAFNFDNLNLKYYKDYYVELKNKIEIRNGLQWTTGLAYHYRIPVKEGKNKEINDDEVIDIINEDYNDFAPYVGLSYTPRQYFRMEGRHKEYLYSDFPTISIEYARGIPGLFKSLGNYERMEADIHQSISLGLLRHFSYHFSGGFFSKQKSVYFADFKYFTRRNFPESWEDPIGGRFNLLRSEWYNASTSFIQGHFVYESPFILSNLLNASRHVLTERFYFSKLWTPALPNYTELGYGFGNHIFNMAAFLSFENHKCQRFGIRFAFEGF